MVEVALTAADLRAAVAAGQLTEAQAAGLTALAESRAGQRAAMVQVDEPFELFRGFNEVFVTVGLVMLLIGLKFFAPDGSGFDFASARSHNAIPFAVWAIFMGGLIWGLAEYFTRRRRMIAPSSVLVLYLAFVLGTGGGSALTSLAGLDTIEAAIAAFAIGALAATVFYLRFGLPFAVFPAGVCALVAALTATGLVDEVGFERLRQGGSMSGFLDMGSGTAFPLVTLVFGLAAFALAMRYDLRDRHRITRHAATAFWLHLLAAPAIVNTAAFTLYTSGGAAATLGLIGFLLAMSAIALVIDRRSFLLSGVGYVAALMLLGLGAESFAVVLVLLGILILGLGAGWVPLRSALMRTLPDFPGKDRLPPYAPSGAVITA